jgi:hypothetical protein
MFGENMRGLFAWVERTIFWREEEQCNSGCLPGMRQKEQTTKGEGAALVWQKSR